MTQIYRESIKADISLLLLISSQNMEEFGFQNYSSIFLMVLPFKFDF
jgi:hypothetical protein